MQSLFSKLIHRNQKNNSAIAVSPYPKNSTPVSVIGQRDLAGGTADVMQDIWTGAGDTRPLPANAGEAMDIVSTNAEDADGLTGIHHLTIIYVDADGAQQKRTETLNGLTAVEIGDGAGGAASIRAIVMAFAEAVGSNGGAVGDISIQNKAGDTVFESVPAGWNRNLSCAITIPQNKVLMVTNWGGSESSGADLTFNLLTNSKPYLDREEVQPVYTNDDIFYTHGQSRSRKVDVELAPTHPIEVRHTCKIASETAGGTNELVTAWIYGFLIDEYLEAA